MISSMTYMYQNLIIFIHSTEKFVKLSLNLNGTVLTDLKLSNGLPM